MTTNSYDEGYSACPCFWGRDPSSFVVELVAHVGPTRGLRVLDLGCGEGKNAAYLAQRGAYVDAIDSSVLAIRNARRAWPNVHNVKWQVADVRSLTFEPAAYDIVLAYGLLHCLPDAVDITCVISRIKHATARGGFNVVCAFNSRDQDLAAAHPGFSPTLLTHAEYQALYFDWRLLRMSDADLHETHPHNNIPHSHSMTRFIAQKP